MASQPKTFCGVVVSAGRMMKAVKVQCAKQTYNDFLKKHFLEYQSYLVADPNSSLRQGDVVRIARGWRTSQHINHVVTEIVAPWGPPIEERPKVLSEEERMEIKMRKRAAKLERRAQRRENGIKGESEPERKSREGGMEALVDVVK